VLPSDSTVFLGFRPVVFTGAVRAMVKTLSPKIVLQIQDHGVPVFDQERESPRSGIHQSFKRIHSNHWIANGTGGEDIPPALTINWALPPGAFCGITTFNW